MNKKAKILFISTLLVGVVALTIGFASFSRTLNISTSAGSTTARTNPFLSGIHYNTSIGPQTASAGGNVTNLVTGTMTTDTWGGISFRIDSNKATATIRLVGFIQNESEYDAFLTNIKTVDTMGNLGRIKCTASTGTDATLVRTACSKMSMTVQINSSSSGNEEATATSTSAMNKTVTKDVLLAKNSSAPMYITFTYDNDSTLPDGTFTVTLPAVTYDYSSASPSGN